jgi:two-component system response regulator AtoC
MDGFRVAMRCDHTVRRYPRTDVSDDLETQPVDVPEVTPHAVIVAGAELRVVELPTVDEFVIGRGRGAGLVVDHPTVSREHARLRLRPRLAIQDLGGSNGTIVRGRRLAPEAWSDLLDGEVVHLGEVAVLLRLHGHQPAELTPSWSFESLEPTLAKVAAGSVSVLILGETGAGKEVCAETIHRLSPRAGRTFLRLHCAALPETLLEGELFGYERGAFTGAIAAKVGLIESAAGGTVFLDEVGELPPAVQVKLLRVLDSREVLRLGGLTPRTVDVRFVAATHRDLRAEVQAGRFREDLYYRLSAVTVRVAPLRERRHEIPGLAAEFVAHASRDLGIAKPAGFTAAALESLTGHAWPGNVRELRNVVTRAVLLSGGDAIDRRHLAIEPALVRAPSSDAHEVSRPPATGGDAATGGDPERARILEVLERFGGNQSRAARELGISRGTLISRLNAYGVARPRKP